MRTRRTTLSFPGAALAGGVLAASLLLAGGSAVAEPVPEGPYVGIGGGLNLNDSGDVRANGVSRDIDTDLGFVGLGSFGYAFGNGLRAEVEGGHRRNSTDTWGSTGIDGDVSAWHAMLNALYDFDLGGRFTPYVGAGVGAAVVSVDMRNRAAGINHDDTDVSFAYQAILGVGYDVSDAVALTADYRFFHALDSDTAFSSGTGRGPGDDFMNHAFVVGLRYAFGAPDRPATAPAAPAPRPAAAPARLPEVPTSYLVFFDFDSARLTPDAAGIVDVAADNALRIGRTRIEVTGHADRAGARPYNMVLSQKRAQSVMDRLVSRGIPRDHIAVFAEGEDRPLIPSGDGVREAQNRRVEIILP